MNFFNRSLIALTFLFSAESLQIKAITIDDIFSENNNNDKEKIKFIKKNHEKKDIRYASVLVERINIFEDQKFIPLYTMVEKSVSQPARTFLGIVLTENIAKITNIRNAQDGSRITKNNLSIERNQLSTSAKLALGTLGIGLLAGLYYLNLPEK